jgi:hypothetical protein
MHGATLKIWDSVWFNTFWHRRSVTALVSYWWLAESYVTVMPSVTCMDLLHWWCIHVAHVVPPSTALAFVTNMSEKCEPPLPSAIFVKLDIICWLEKDDILVIKANKMHYFANLFDHEFYMFRTDLLSIFRSLSTVHTAVGFYGFWFRASSNIHIKQPTRHTLSCKIFYCLVV